MLKKTIYLIALLIFAWVMVYLAVSAGSPEAIWFYCDMLHAGTLAGCPS